ncbi:MAG: transposase [Patescibacteria group bacterium]|nr:transposase [Patescibacteria group bacterium]
MLLRQFQEDYYYHVYNRGVDKRQVFLDRWDYVRFLESLREFNKLEATGGFYRKFLSSKFEFRGPTPNLGVGPLGQKKLVDIIAYCLNPNHYHLLLRQNTENGISEFMKRIGTGYACYFNYKYKRSGSLFEGKYKAREARSADDLIKLSVYVNCNSGIHNLVRKENWLWSSYLDYVGLRKGTLCETKEVFQEFSNPEDYKRFCEELIPDIKLIKNLEKHGLE